MNRTTTIILLFVELAVSCQKTGPPEVTEHQPLLDTLLTAYGQLRQAAQGSDPDGLIALLDPEEAALLHQISRQHGYQSLRSYLSQQMSGWPNLDTLEINSLIVSDNYARLTVVGPVYSLDPYRERLRYTALLFRRTDRWRLSAMCGVVKNRFDQYGHQIAFHETDLPPKLRFPRLF